MQFPDILKKYRANKDLTQKQLAEQLGVPLISVARIEQGINVRLELEPINLLGNMMQDKSLDMVDGISEIRTWFQYAAGFQTSNSLQANVRRCMIEQFIRDDIPQKILCDFAGIGFKQIGGQYSGKYLPHVFGVRNEKEDPREFDLIFENKVTQKIWAVDFQWAFLSPFEAANPWDLLANMYSSIGKSCCNGRRIQKFSLITNLLEKTDYLKSTIIAPQNLQFDVSVINYNLSKYQMDFEKSLTFFKDGRGAFDIDVEDKSDFATLNYANWTLLLNKQQ